jgi:hypothetical protein
LAASAIEMVRLPSGDETAIGRVPAPASFAVVHAPPISAATIKTITTARPCFEFMENLRCFLRAVAVLGDYICPSGPTQWNDFRAPE